MSDSITLTIISNPCFTDIFLRYSFSWIFIILPFLKFEMQILWCKNINEFLIKPLHEMYFHKSSDSSFQSENLNQLILIFEVRFSEVYVLSKLPRRDVENVFSQFIQTWEVSHWNMFVRKKNVLVFLIFHNHIIICNSDKTNYGYMPRSLVAEYTLQNFIVFFFVSYRIF